MIYILDESENPVFIEVEFAAPYEIYNYSGDFYDSIEYVKSNWGEVISNGAFFGNYKLKIDGNISYNMFLEIGYYKCVCLISCNDIITQDLLRKIAESFVAYYPPRE